MRLFVEIEGQAPEPIAGAGALIAFMSFAVMRGFGAQHPLIALADRLHEHFGVRLGPLTTFYSAVAEDAEDREKADLAWQPAGPVVEAFEAVTAAITEDAQAQTFVRRAGADGLLAEVEAARAIALRAEDEGRRLRLLFEE